MLSPLRVRLWVIFTRSANDLPVIVTLFPDALSRVLTAPDHRRRGLGSAMVGEAMAYSFIEHEVGRIDLGVSATSTSAIRCYERLGFRHVGTWLGGVAAGVRQN
jgi:RimJ/RimL family protein N-acetyltransferase